MGRRKARNDSERASVLSFAITAMPLDRAKIVFKIGTYLKLLLTIVFLISSVVYGLRFWFKGIGLSAMSFSGAAPRGDHRYLRIHGSGGDGVRHLWGRQPNPADRRGGGVHRKPVSHRRGLRDRRQPRARRRGGRRRLLSLFRQAP